MIGRLFSVLLMMLAVVAAKAQFIVYPSTPIAIGNAPDIVIQSADDIIFGSPVNFKNANVNLQLLGTGKLVNGSVKPDTVGKIILNGTGNYSVIGKWVVLNDIDFQNGNLVTPTATVLSDRITYMGPNLGAKSTGGGSVLSHINGPFFIKSTGTLTFPVGSATDYYPAQLTSVNDATAIFGMDYVPSDPAIPQDSLSADVDQVFTTWHWRLGVFNRSTFAGAPISLSLNGTETFLGTEKAVIIEKDSLGYINDLSGSLNTPYVSSNENISSKGGIYAIAASKDVSIKIHKIITPNNDGHNETLVIEGIDAYTNNKVTLLDRWGAVYFTKSGFTKYDNPASPTQTDFDYTKLNNGNYICVVEFTDASGKTHKPKPQMITVLK